MYKCNICGKKIRGSVFYCSVCKQKEIKKIERQSRTNANRRLESEMKKFDSYLKSGKRTY